MVVHPWLTEALECTVEEFGVRLGVLKTVDKVVWDTHLSSVATDSCITGAPSASTHPHSLPLTTMKVTSPSSVHATAWRWLCSFLYKIVIKVTVMYQGVAALV